MRYCTNLSVYNQISFNEGAIKNIIEWFKKKWEWFKNLLKYFKDKIFKPKVKIIEEKLKEATNPKAPIANKDIVIETFLMAHDGTWTYKGAIEQCIDQLISSREETTDTIINNSKTADSQYWIDMYNNLVELTSDNSMLSLNHNPNSAFPPLGVVAIEHYVKNIFHVSDTDAVPVNLSANRDAIIQVCNDCVNGIKLVINLLDHPEKLIGDINIYEKRVAENVENQDAIKCHQMLMTYSIKISQITIAEIQKSLDKISNECIRVLNILNGADADKAQATQESTICNIRIV